MYPHVPWYSLPPSCSFSHSYPVSSQLWLVPCGFFHSYSPTPSSLCLLLSLPLNAEWVQSSHSQRSQQEWWQRQSSLIPMSPCRDTCVHLHLLHGATEELEEIGHKPRRDIQETFRENKCLACLFCRQNANAHFSEAYKVAKQE